MLAAGSSSRKRSAAARPAAPSPMMTNLRRAMKGAHHTRASRAQGSRVSCRTLGHGCSATRGGGVGSAAEAVLMQRTGSVLLPTLIAAFFLTGCPEKKVEKEEPAAPTAVDKSGAAEEKEKAAAAEDEHGEDQD